MKKSRSIVLILAIILLSGYSVIVSLIAFGGNKQPDNTQLDNATSENTGSLFFKNYEASGVSSALADSASVKVTQQNDIYFFDGAGTDQALIFYPGANVEYSAYAPLMKKLADQGMDCFLVKMPLDYAFLGIPAADIIINAHPEYTHWNLAGHSLGGAMIATFASLTSHHIDGVYLLAAYTTCDISDVDEVLVIYGSEDGVLDRDKVTSGRKYCPENYREYVIQGGNHAQFGSYGQQDKDGTATISAEEQLNQTVTQILLNKK